jgi:hypothetical protein
MLADVLGLQSTTRVSTHVRPSIHRYFVVLPSAITTDVDIGRAGNIE